MANGSFGGGDGSLENPFLVEDAQDFQAMDGMTSYYPAGLPYLYFKQTKDISFNGMEITPIGSTRVETGSFQGVPLFCGSYDGGGHSLLGVTTHGLFLAANSFFKNIKIHCEVNGGSGYGGALVDDADSCRFINCEVYGAIRPMNPINSGGVGGLVGAASDCSFDNCLVDADVEGEYVTGGLVGYAYYSTFHKCASKGFVNGDDNVGGFVGDSSYSDYVNCYSIATISVQSEYDYAGGFVGRTDGDTFKNCYAASSVPTLADSGGFAGYLYSHSGANSCYYDADVSEHSDAKLASPQSTEAMMKRATFREWDFGSVWGIDEGESYPYFINGKRTQCESISMTRLLV